MTVEGIKDELGIVTTVLPARGGAFHPSPFHPHPSAADGPSLIAQLLAEQQQLTAVEQFARDHAHGNVPAQAKYYSKLIPAAPPGPGQQYAFEVDLDRCSGCKACVTACHSLNGLDERETWRDVGLLVGGTAALPVMQHVTTACHHCLQPACMTACPVNAYEKHPVTGIVKHLDDQCFGCQYCTLACPYDVPKYHREKGIVRKCDLCSDRLAHGEAPACVQACPHEAIAVRTVNVDEVIANSEADGFLPASPDPQFTLPTTHYKTARAFPRNLLPADYYAVGPQHPHWPLILMLVLTQLSVGAFAVELALEHFLGHGMLAALRPLHALSALLFGLTALAASTFHLGRPQYAFRAVVGLRHSWLSREIVAFGLFAVLACLFAAVCWGVPLPEKATTALAWGVAASGLAGVFCSVMIYVFTQREFWSATQAGTKFLLTAVVLGIAGLWLTLLLLTLVSNNAEAERIVAGVGNPLCRGLIGAMALKLCFEAFLFRHLTGRHNTPLKRSALLLTGPLSNVTLARFASGFLGGIVMPLFLLDQPPEGGFALLLVHVSVLFVACLAGELLERYLFFAAVSAPRMPGGLR
jgi:Fe-S-cluster-containing dehydrogenase component/DMSO reductase anchor subunit